MEESLANGAVDRRIPPLERSRPSGPRDQRRETIGLFAALAILVSVAALAYRSIDATAKTLSVVEHANEVLKQLQNVTSASARSSTARRAYLVAGDSSQLGDRASLDGRLHQALDDLGALVAADPAQRHRLERFRDLTEQRMADLDNSVQKRQRDGSGTESAEGVALGAGIRAAREEMEQENNRLIAEGDTRTRRDVARTKLAEIMGTAASFALLLFVFLRLNNEIGHRRASEAALRAAKEAADSANRELEAFSYSVAHDLRAPLRAIDGFSRVLEEDHAEQLDPTGLEYFDKVRSAAQRMGRLIDALLGLSRVARGAMDEKEIDLSQVARQVTTRLQDANPGRSVEVKIEEGLVGKGDPQLLTAAFDNLFGNAWKFTGQTPRPSVEFGRQLRGDEVVFFVRDNGAGFEQSYAPKLFQPFQRLHAANQFEGTGIGLATVERIIRRHGGRIWAEGKVGAGATFFFTL